MSLFMSYIVGFVLIISLGIFAISGPTLLFFILFPLFLIMICNSGVLNQNENTPSQEHYIDANTAIEYSRLLDKIMRREKFYLIQNLRIDEISNHLMLTPQELDYIINQAKHKTFNQYLDDLRVLEVKEIINIPEYEDCDLKCLAEACGFSDFNDFENALFRVLHTNSQDFKKKYLEHEA